MMFRLELKQKDFLNSISKFAYNLLFLFDSLGIGMTNTFTLYTPLL